jgi:excisionase family DNA binding protein
MTERWMSVNEISAHLGVAAITIYRWLEKGLIPAHRVVKQWRFSQAEVDAWVKSKDDHTVTTERLNHDS